MSDSDIMAGSFIQFECISDSRPPVNFYRYLNYLNYLDFLILVINMISDIRWHIGNRELSRGRNEKYLYLRIEADMHKQELKCDAKNDVSTQTAAYLIELSCN